MNGLTRKRRKGGRHDSIKWAKGDPYPYRVEEKKLFPVHPSGASFETARTPPRPDVSVFFFFFLFFFLSYRRLHDNERSKEPGPVERDQFREIVAGRLRSRASSRNREKLCVTTRYFFVGCVYIYIHIVRCRYRRPPFQTLSRASFQLKYFWTEFGMCYFSRNVTQ